MESDSPQENTSIHSCSLCMMSFPTRDYFTHLIEEHYNTIIALLAIYCPETDIPLFFQLLQTFVTNSLENEEINTYEYLLDLCNSIGYHYVGVSDIQKVATECTMNERCPICLDETEKEGYQTIKCRHEFCKECFMKWTNDHKSCPLCKSELEDTVK